MRCSSALGAGEPQAADVESSPSSGRGPPSASARRSQLERDADDIATCFALERVLRRDGPGRVFAGEITGLIPAGAFVAFAGPETSTARDLRRPRSRACCRCGCCAPLPPGKRGRPATARAQVCAGARTPARGGARARRRAAEREWWELNEEGTILRGERTGAAVRLGDR